MRRCRALTHPAKVFGLVALLVVVLGAGAALAAEHFLRAPIRDGETVTILLLGSDEGPWRNSDPLRGRADAFHLLAVSPARDRVTIVSFPRDSYVSVPGRGRTRINACLVSGPEACLDTVEANWGFRPEHYLLTDFNGLKAAVARFGGVEVNVEHPVHEGGSAITDTGRQRITGSQAVTFARDRKNRPGGDFARATKQTELLREAHRELWEEGAHPSRIASSVAILQQTTVTDLRPDELLRLAFVAMTIDPANVDQVTLPGSPTMVGSASVVALADRAHAIVRDVAEDGVLSE